MTINTKENNDLQILQREYRNMEANRRAFAEESHLVRIDLIFIFEDTNVI